jgi:anti-sigma regulatory factor (Ser/Thr protein kinase)
MAHDDLPPAEADFEPQTESVPAARRFVRETLESWGLDEGVVWSAALAVTELATNAVMHAATQFAVAVRQVADGVRLEVSDGSVRRPRVRDYGSDATTGRGLGLVAALSAQWGTAARPGGKSIWCLLEPEEPAHEDVEPDLDAFVGDDDTDADVATVTPAAGRRVESRDRHTTAMLRSAA